MDHYAKQMITESEHSENDLEDDTDNGVNLHSKENVNDDATEDTICSDCNDSALNDPEHGFILPCESPHSLVWAKYEYQFHRPAKVMFATFHQDEDPLVCVRFFGDHVEANVSIGECFLFSEKRPEDSEVSNLEIYTLTCYEKNLDVLIMHHIVLVSIREICSDIQWKW